MICSRESDCKIATSITACRACPGHAQDRSCREAPELARIERGVRSDHNHARAVGLILSRLIDGWINLVGSLDCGLQLLPNGYARDGESAAEICLHEYTNSVSAVCFRQVARTRADTTFPSEDHGTLASADGTLFYWPVVRLL